MTAEIAGESYATAPYDSKNNTSTSAPATFCRSDDASGAIGSSRCVSSAAASSKNAACCVYVAVTGTENR